MTVIWKEKGEWDKEAYTAQHFDSYEDMKNARKAFAGVLSIVSVYGDDITKEQALRYHFEESRPR